MYELIIDKHRDTCRHLAQLFDECVGPIDCITAAILGVDLLFSRLGQLRPGAQ